jgi:hypothetical protein
MHPLPIDTDLAARLPITDVTKLLTDRVSPAIVKDLVSAPDAKTIARWRRGERAPTPERERRLRFALQLALIVGHRGSGEAAQAWFETHNRLLDDTPLALLRESLDEVRHRLLSAAREFAGV